jgi:hypothetical protein
MPKLRVSTEAGQLHYARALPIAETAGSADLLATVLHNVSGLAHARGRFTDGIPPAARLAPT